MRVVTTVHEDGFSRYGFKWMLAQKQWPECEFRLYGEGMLGRYRVEDLQRLRVFKERHRNYRAPNWEFDIVRFSNKVFAAYDAFYDYEGLCVWLDADCVTYKPIPEGFIEGLLPKEHYMALFKRQGYHSETGFWIQDGSHPEHKAFWDTWIQWFESGEFRRLKQWHDCTTLDETIKLFEKDGRIKTHNLSGEFSKDMHPMAKVELGKYIDHTKGARKDLGYSPENEHRRAS